MNVRLAASVACCSIVVAACSGGGGGPSRCESGDVDCLLASMMVAETNGTAVSLRAIDASLLTTTSGTPGARSIWSIAAGGNGSDGWNGAHWVREDGSGDILTSVWTASPTDAWAVGASQRIKRWDGASWTTVSIGTAAGLAFNAVWGSGASDVHAGGTGGALVHWNGSTWSPVDAGTTADIVAIGGSGASDVWIGGAGSLLRHWDGFAWSPSNPNVSIDVAAIWATSDTDAWAIGSNGGIVIRWDGFSWTPATLPGATYLYDVWASGANDAWVIAYEITQGTFLLHWDGISWSPEPDPVGMTEFAGLWGRSATDLWLAGTGNMGHWNGNGWTVVPASPGSHVSIHGLALDPSNGNGLPPGITNQPPPMVFEGRGARVDLPLDWIDPSGCTPAFCMQVCNPSLRCSTKVRCSPLVRDGRFAGSTIRGIGYRAEPADSPESFTLNVVPVSSPDCEDPIARLISGDPRVTKNDPTAIEQTLLASPSPTPTGTPGSHDGTWNLQVAIDTCYVFTHTVPITISGGTFSGHLFQYCANAVDGTTRLGNNDCGADITEDVSVDLTVTGNAIDGNLTLAGDACNGANGFSGSFDTTTTGSAGSAWGTLTFSQ